MISLFDFFLFCLKVWKIFQSFKVLRFCGLSLGLITHAGMLRFEATADSLYHYKRRQNVIRKLVTHSAPLLCYFIPLNAFWRHIRSITDQTHTNLESIWLLVSHTLRCYMLLNSKWLKPADLVVWVTVFTIHSTSASIFMGSVRNAHLSFLFLLYLLCMLHSWSAFWYMPCMV